MQRSEEEIDTLVTAAQNGDKVAFGELYDQFLNPIYRFLFFRVSSEPMAEDLAAEVFFKAIKHLKKYQKKENMPFAAWLFRIAKNVLIDHYRKHVPLEEIPETHIDDSDLANAKQGTVLGIERRRIFAALAKLPEMQAQAIILKYFSDQKNSEIALVLEKSETAIRILQSRGLKKLRDFLQYE